MPLNLQGILTGGLESLATIASVRLYYKQNNYHTFETLLVLIVPQVTGYLVSTNSEFGFTFRIENFPSLIIIAFIVIIYSVFEFGTKDIKKLVESVQKIFILSVMIYVIALLFNLLYSGLVNLFNLGNPLKDKILGYFGDIDQSIFAVIYGVPFIVLSLLFISANTVRATSWRRFLALFRSSRFNRATTLCVCCGILQYVAFTVAKAP